MDNIKKFVVLSLLMFLSSYYVFSLKNDLLLVINFKGTVMKREGDKWRSVVLNEFLGANEKVYIAKNGFINLFDDGKKEYFVIHGEREFDLSNMVTNTKVYSGSSDALVKALEKFANIFLSVTESESSKKSFRAFDNIDIIPIYPKNGKVSENLVNFSWLKKIHGEKVRFTLLDEEFNSIIDTIVSENHISYRFPVYECGKEFLWQVASLDEKSQVVSQFRSPCESDLSSFKSMIDSLDIFFSDNKSQNYYMIKGILCEDMGFYLDSYESYKQAYLMSNKETEYENAINDFLSRQEVNATILDILLGEE